MKNALSLLTILCASALAGCYTPQYIYVTHVKHGVCEKRKITDKNNYGSERVAVLPLMECDGNISITPEDFAKVRGRDK